jgi:hypothetical protein
LVVISSGGFLHPAKQRIEANIIEAVLVWLFPIFARFTLSILMQSQFLSRL